MGQGLYYHVMMMDDIANQLTEAVPPHRIFQEIGNFYRRGVVNYTIINVSDVRPVPLSLEAIMRFLWDPEPYVCRPRRRLCSLTKLGAAVTDMSPFHRGRRKPSTCTTGVLVTLVTLSLPTLPTSTPCTLTYRRWCMSPHVTPTTP